MVFSGMQNLVALASFISEFSWKFRLVINESFVSLILFVVVDSVLSGVLVAFNFTFFVSWSKKI